MKKRSVARIAFFLLFLGVVCFAAWKLYGIYSVYNEGTETYDDLANQYVTVQPEQVTEEESADSGSFSVSFDELLAECPDVVAWIYCEGTPINYPIVQSKDNNYYLRRLMNGKYNISGTLFLDYRNSPDFTDWNNIVYGHNMKNGTMFGSLPKYSSQAFYDEHPVMQLLTPTQNFEIELIGGYVTPADSDTYSFPSTKEKRDAFAEKVFDFTDFVSKAEIFDEEKLITLSTCVYDYDNARYVVVGLLRETGVSSLEDN